MLTLIFKLSLNC